MRMNLSTAAVLTPVLFMAGNPRGSDLEPRGTVVRETSCEEEDLLSEVQASLSEGKEGRVEFVVAAGPNRIASLPATIRLVNEVAQTTHQELSLVLRVDEGELSWTSMVEGRMDEADSRWDLAVGHLLYPDGQTTVADWLATVDPRVEQILAIQPMGTSYTEVADSLAETNASKVIFLAHNWPLQERLSLAAENTVAAGISGEQLTGVQVLCHGNTLNADFAKEVASYALDGSTSLVGGHDAVLETSRGGHRWARIKAWIGL
jgi:hypothetical protein